MSRHVFGARLLALILTIAFIGSSISSAYAQASTFLNGTVTLNGKPVPNAIVTLSGENLTLTATTNDQGRFSFNALIVGTYTVSTPGSGGRVSMQVDLTSAGATISLDTAPIAEIGRVAVTTAPVTKSSGTDVVINGTQLARAPAANSIPDILTQLPDAARGSNGQIHMNGDHNGINYVIDGVQIPEGLNRVLGNEIDPANIGFVEVLEGAYPAQYGDKFAGVLNISTKAQTGPAGVTFDARGGSYNLTDSVLGFHNAHRLRRFPLRWYATTQPSQLAVA